MILHDKAQDGFIGLESSAVYFDSFSVLIGNRHGAVAATSVRKFEFLLEMLLRGWLSLVFMSCLN